MFVLASASVADAAAESCTLGATFAVMHGGEVERAGDLVDSMTKSGTVTFDVEHMTATYDLRVTYDHRGRTALRRRLEHQSVREQIVARVP